MRVEQSNNSEQSSTEPSKNLKYLRTYLAMGFLIEIFIGLIHIWSILTQGLTVIRLGDAVVNLVVGMLFYASARLVAEGKPLAMWVFALTIPLSLGYSFAVGRGFNTVYAVIGAAMLLLFVVAKADNELA